MGKKNFILAKSTIMADNPLGGVGGSEEPKWILGRMFEQVDLSHFTELVCFLAVLEGILCLH